MGFDSVGVGRSSLASEDVEGGMAAVLAWPGELQTGAAERELPPLTGPDRAQGKWVELLKQSANPLRYLKRHLERKAGKAAYPVQFALVGLTGMAVDLLAFALLRCWLPLAPARALAIWLAMTWNYWLNRRVTFSTWRRGFRWRHYFLFCGSCLAGAAANWLTSVALSTTTEGFARYPTAAAALGVAAGFVLNYSLSRRFVFRPEKMTR